MENYEQAYKQLQQAADWYGILGVSTPQNHQRRRFQFIEKVAPLLAKDVLSNKPTIDDHCITMTCTRTSLSSITQRPDEAIRDAIRNISLKTKYKIRINQ